MRIKKQQHQLHGWIKYGAIGTVLIGLAGCVYDPYPPPPTHGNYQSGPHSYYDYPNNYRYYDENGRLQGGYSDDPDLRYNARERHRWPHSDDHNYHNRDDLDHWDY